MDETTTEALVNREPTRKYQPRDVLAAQIEKAFTYHPPKDDQPGRYVRLRLQAKYLAEEIVATTPPSREQALALTKLEEACFWANAAIARNE